MYETVRMRCSGEKVGSHCVVFPGISYRIRLYSRVADGGHFHHIKLGNFESVASTVIISVRRSDSFIKSTVWITVKCVSSLYSRTEGNAKVFYAGAARCDADE